jgi:uncharacterized protein DUF397
MHTPVPAGLSWRKSTFSDTGENCVELAQSLGQTYLRDSKNPDGRVLRLNLPALVGAAKAGLLEH